MHCKQGPFEILDKFMKRYVKIWRSMEQTMNDKFAAKVFLDNINHLLITCGLDYVRGPFIDMVHILIEKERYIC